MRMQEEPIIERLHGCPNSQKRVEIVERKGLGHPDSLADGIAEAVSRALIKEYLVEANAILHHNVDKVLIIAGQSKPSFGGGKVTKPIHTVVAGRATKPIDRAMEEIVGDSVKEYLGNTVRNLQIDTDLVVDTRVGLGSTALRDVFGRQGGNLPTAGSTAIGVGFAPLTPTEKLVLEVEKHLNSTLFKKKLPATGEDVRVIGVRKDKKVILVVSMAFVDRWLRNVKEYCRVKEEVKNDVLELADRTVDFDIEARLNVADDIQKEALFLTATGTSAEMGDDGMTGRGNRLGGIISINRQSAMECVAGKNPVNHTGKIYQILAAEMAREIVEKCPAIAEAYVRLVSQIGLPINEPLVSNVQVLLDENAAFNNNLKGSVASIISGKLDDSPKIINDILKRNIRDFI